MPRTYGEYTIGEHQSTRVRVITAADILAFADLTGDHHPAHTDIEFAQERFGGQLAHGVLTFGIVVGLTVEDNPLAVAYGYDRIRFPGPVLAGDTVRASSEVIELRDHKNPEIGLVVKQYTGINQRGEVVLVAQHTLAVQRTRSAEESPSVEETTLAE
ncbi:MaoC family dehydratase [Leucobacter sp. M11]|nr:MaoC family dehydratase [Leucobacter sp. M11]